LRCKIEADAAEIGFLLNRRFWGHGYAGEAASAVVDWVFTIPNIYKVWATCDTENAASARVLEKLGFEREKILLKAIVRPQISLHCC
jgi:RimJ/RimL family protein N-acetyltransferase